MISFPSGYRLGLGELSPETMRMLMSFLPSLQTLINFVPLNEHVNVFSAQNPQRARCVASFRAMGLGVVNFEERSHSEAPSTELQAVLETVLMAVSYRFAQFEQTEQDQKKPTSES
jgi:hypothetical protein